MRFAVGRLRDAEPLDQVVSLERAALPGELADHGLPGLSAEAQSRLFEPFYTTKEAGVGLGLGLAISAGIVSDYGGTLAGANHPDGGALFTLELPVAPEEGEECEDTTK